MSLIRGSYWCTNILGDIYSVLSGEKKEIVSIKVCPFQLTMDTESLKIGLASLSVDPVWILRGFFNFFFFFFRSLSAVKTLFGYEFESEGNPHSSAEVSAFAGICFLYAKVQNPVLILAG